MSDQSTDSVQLRGVFLNATRELFSNPENYAEQANEQNLFRWLPNNEGTLGVELDYVYNPKNLSARHCIYVGVEDMQFAAAEFVNPAVEISDDRSRHTLSQQTTTAATIRCVSPLPDEALRLAVISAGYFLGMRPLFVRELSLRDFRPISISKPTPIEKAPVELFESVFSIRLVFDFAVMSIIEGHRIKKFGLSATPV